MRLPPPSPSRFAGVRWRFILAAAIGCALVGVVLAGCGAFRARVDPYADVRQSWQAGVEIPDERLAAMPFYSITARIDPGEKTYAGVLALDFTVSSTIPLRELYFRTYPNLLAFGGNLQLTGARVDGTTVNFLPVADKTAVRLDLPKPLQPRARANVWLVFNGKVEHKSTPGEYTIFGYNEDVLNLTSFYPILASRRGEEWALDLPHPQGDVGFHDAALYRVSLTTPPGQTIVATGTEITTTAQADGWVTTRYALGPAREFTVLLSPSLRVMDGETLGVRVHSYYFEADLDAARKALYDGMAALEIYSDAFGAYPYREMSITQAPLTYHGMEFPGLSAIGSQAYNIQSQELENLVVHEVAHQWWYNQVGSDQVRTPWLDEGLAEYSMYVYYERRYGLDTAEQLRALRWQVPLDSLRKRGKDQPIGLSVREYKENYEQLVYGKGALFFAALRDELGAEKFGELLRTWLQQEQWRIATPAEFKALAERIAGRSLDAVFTEWVSG